MDFYSLIGVRDKGDIIKISLDHNKTALKKYLGDDSKKNHYLDLSNQFFNRKIIKATPSFITLDEQGKVIDVKMGISFIF